MILSAVESSGATDAACPARNENRRCFALESAKFPGDEPSDGGRTGKQLPGLGIPRRRGEAAKRKAARLLTVPFVPTTRATA